MTYSKKGLLHAFFERQRKLSMESKPYDGVYLAAQFNGVSNRKLLNFLKLNNLPTMTARELHVTIIFSRRYAKLTPRPVLNEVVTVSKPTLFGKRGGTLVLLLNSNYLITRHNALMGDHDLMYDYDEYKPHITIATEFTGDVSKLKGWNMLGNLILASEYSEELKLND